MPYSNRACIAPRSVSCGKRGHRFRLNHHMLPKCLGQSCRYLVRLDQLPQVDTYLVVTLRR